MAYLDDLSERQWIDHARALLKGSRAEKGYFRYTYPAPDETAQQSPFHSALHAMVYRWFDADMAADELKSAAAKQVEDGTNQGMIPHRTYWQSDSTGWSQPDRSDITALPLLTYSTVQAYHMTGDTNLLERLYPRLVAWHEWFDRQRDPDSTGLVAAVHPEETLAAHLNLPSYVDAATNPYWNRDLALNALRAADLDSLAHIAEDMGNTAEEARWKQRALKAKAAVQLALSKTDDAGMDAQIAALFCGCATQEQADAIVSRMTVGGRELAYPAGDRAVVSMLLNWLAYIGLRRYGYKDRARALTEKSLLLVDASGFYALYDADTGEGVGAENTGEAGLVVDMFFREKQGQIPRPKCFQEIE